MSDDDVYGPELTPPPPTSPIVRGTAVALVTVALATSLGCSSSPSGADAGPGVDAGPISDVGAPGIDLGVFNPGVRVDDAGRDTGNPGDHP